MSTFTILVSGSRIDGFHADGEYNGGDTESSARPWGFVLPRSRR